MSEGPSREQAVSAVDTLVRYIESVNGDLREGLARTPERVVESFDEIYSGYSGDAESILNATFNSEGYEGIVLLRDIEFHSVCEHHLLPFAGKANIAYIPIDRIIGMSDLSRMLALHSCKLQNQARLPKRVADAIESVMPHLGCSIILEISHSCMR